MQDAVLQALQQWPTDPPRDASAWLTTAARRRFVDRLRSDAARRAREDRTPGFHGRDESDHVGARDDSLDLLILCCHPALTPGAQIPLTLRAVAGLTTAQIAQGLLIPETTAGQRIARAKAAIRAAGGSFPRATLQPRIDAVFSVLYLMYTAGHTATTGTNLYDTDLADEAIRLTRLLHAAAPGDAEASGLLALMLLTDARRNARVDDRGVLVPLDEQDRSRWDRALISEGTTLLRETLRGGGRPVLAAGRHRGPA